MSKCKPKPGPELANLFEMGVRLDEEKRDRRYVVIRIPYDALLEDPQVQAAFQHLITISVTEEGTE